MSSDNGGMPPVPDRRSSRLRLFRWLGKERSAELQNVCSDIWKPYLKVIKKKAVNAINIFDRYHVMAKMSTAIDKVRAGETRQMKADGLEPLLTHSRFILLKRRENRRIEALFFVYFLVLLVQAFVERELRQTIHRESVEALPLYPEERCTSRPTAEQIFRLLSFTQASHSDP